MKNGFLREEVAFPNGRTSVGTMATVSTGITDNRTASAWIEKATLDLKQRQEHLENNKVKHQEVDLNSITADIKREHHHRFKRRFLLLLVLLVGGAFGVYFGLEREESVEAAETSAPTTEIFLSTDTVEIGAVCQNLAAEPLFSESQFRFFVCLGGNRKKTVAVCEGSNDVTVVACDEECRCENGIFVDARDVNGEDGVVGNACVSATVVESSCESEAIDSVVDVAKLAITFPPTPAITLPPFEVIPLPGDPDTQPQV